MQRASDLQYNTQQSRFKIRQEYAALTEACNLTHRLSESVHKKPWSWIGGLFLAGVSLPLFFRKQKKTQSPTVSLISKSEKKPTSISKIALASSLFQNKATRSALYSIASFLFPLAQEMVVNYLASKKNNREDSASAL